MTAAEWAAFAELVARRCPPGGLDDALGLAARRARRPTATAAAGLTRVAFDTREAGLDARPAIVKLNAAEAAHATSADRPTGPGRSSRPPRCTRPPAAPRSSRAAGRRGDGGADGGALHGSLDAGGRYPVGSGDAFLAGLVVALDAGAGWPTRRCAAALGAGAANAEQPGAGRLDRGRAEALAEAAVVIEG